MKELTLFNANLPQWVPIHKGERGYSAGDFRCSECGKPLPCWKLTPFCPNCGVKMDTTETDQ